jgi:hypothetical protein
MSKIGLLVSAIALVSVSTPAFSQGKKPKSCEGHCARLCNTATERTLCSARCVPACHARGGPTKK